MKKSLLLYLFLLSLVLCRYGIAVHAQSERGDDMTSSIDGEAWQFDEGVLQPGKRARIDFESTRGKEEAPVVRFSAPILDKSTRQPVVSDVYVLDGTEKRDPLPAEIAQTHTTYVQLQLPGEANDMLVVQASGYEPFYLHFRYRTYTSKQFTGQVELVPLPVAPVLEMQQAGLGEVDTDVL